MIVKFKESIVEFLANHESGFSYYSLKLLEKKTGNNFASLPKTIKVLLENLLRNYDEKEVKFGDIEKLINYKKNSDLHAIAFNPTRVLMQDFTGIPAVVDLATMRDAVNAMGKDPSIINPDVPVDLVIDHSVQVDYYGTDKALQQNSDLDMKRNLERYELLSWAQKAFKNLRVVPPGTGICHQVNIEFLSNVITLKSNTQQKLLAFPDTIVGTDSHTTMANGLGILGWGVGGIEAEAVMLKQPIYMLIPEVIGFKLINKLSPGVTATDLVLSITNALRKRSVVSKFIEFFGEGVANLSLADRATIANMAPECGSTVNFFAIDQKTLDYLYLTGRSNDQIKIIENYSKEQGLWFSPNDHIEFTDVIELDLAKVLPVLAGPKRPQDKVYLNEVPSSFNKLFIDQKRKNINIGNKFDLKDGAVVIAAITSCTNTSNPSVIVGAGLIAKKAVELGMDVKPWVKTSLAPGSKVVAEYLSNSGLQKYLDKLKFNVVGYGCTTCIGNSGPLDDAIDSAIAENEITSVAVLSGNRNFEGRIHPRVKANYLASPMLVMIYALCGNIDIDLTVDPVGKDKSGNDVYLKDLWPKDEEIDAIIHQFVNRELFVSKYSNVFDGDEQWKKISANNTNSVTYSWDEKSTYVRKAPFFEQSSMHINNIENANIIAIFGDSITTDHISPAGNISDKGPAGIYLKNNGVNSADFNSYGARRGNHEVMMRGTFANIRIKNDMLNGKEGGLTKYIPTGEIMSIYDAAMLYKKDKKDLVIFAGKEYGTGSSRDWAAKGTSLLGIKAVIAESFERIHKSNLIGMGIMPLKFKNGVNHKMLNLTGEELVDIKYVDVLRPKAEIVCTIKRLGGTVSEDIELICGIDTMREIDYFINRGILQYVVMKNINK